MLRGYNVYFMDLSLTELLWDSFTYQNNSFYTYLVLFSITYIFKSNIFVVKEDD